MCFSIHKDLSPVKAQKHQTRTSGGMSPADLVLLETTVIY